MLPNPAEDDLNLDFYELRDEATKRVFIKRSVQIHFAALAVINTFLVILNLSLLNFQPATWGEIWVFWTLFCWGYGLYVHATVWFTINVQDVGKRIFFIHCLIAIGLIPLLAAINLLTTPGYYWFWWVLGGEIAFIILHYFITFISAGTSLDNAIRNEIKSLSNRITNRDEEIHSI